MIFLIRHVRLFLQKKTRTLNLSHPGLTELQHGLEHSVALGSQPTLDKKFGPDRRRKQTCFFTSEKGIQHYCNRIFNFKPKKWVNG